MIGILLYTLEWLHFSPIPMVANLIGTTLPALNLLMSILLSYPLAIIYHKYIINFRYFRNLYFIITGLDLAFFNFGIYTFHNFIPIIIMYFTTTYVGCNKINVIITLVFNMVYLLSGYVMTESDDYDITWTMPQCVLTLKLISLAFDLYDGEITKLGREISENNKKTALTEPPTLEELIGFVYFPACFLVGPIFSFRRYKDFISDKFPLSQPLNPYEIKGLIRLLLGVIYLFAYQVGGAVFSMKYMQSDEFLESNIFYRHLYCGLWAHFALYKYISCWLLTEAACIRFGLSYNGLNKSGSTTWDGCCNIKLLRFEGATKFQHYIDSFNCNTNYFAAEYIYKRLKFLGNRNISQICTLLFLALWHGTRSGYLVTFLNEFIIIIMEKELETIIAKTHLYIWVDGYLKYVLYFLLKLYTIVFMGWSLVPFDLLVFSKWWAVYSSLYFSGFIIFLPWTFLYKKYLLIGLKKFELMEQVKSN